MWRNSRSTIKLLTSKAEPGQSTEEAHLFQLWSMGAEVECRQRSSLVVFLIITTQFGWERWNTNTCLKTHLPHSGHLNKTLNPSLLPHGTPSARSVVASGRKSSVKAIAWVNSLTVYYIFLFSTRTEKLHLEWTGFFFLKEQCLFSSLWNMYYRNNLVIVLRF